MRELERTPTDTTAPERAPEPIALIGRGRVGGSLALAAETAGLEIRLAGRESLAEACSGAGAVLLCVPDSEITAACELAAAVRPAPALIGHVSGATGLDALAAAAATGAETFSLHPLQTIPDDRTPLAGIPAAIAGSSPDALAAARALALALGMQPFEVPEEARAAYHAAASIASNFLVALQSAATDLLEAAGVEDGRELLTPLVLSTAANWSERGPAALTGPIARGDEATVARHRDALDEHAPHLLPLYEALAEATRRLAAGAER